MLRSKNNNLTWNGSGPRLETGHPVIRYNPSYRANKGIAEIKIALANYKVEYHSISNYLFSAITKRMLSYLSKISEVENKDEYHLNWLLVDLDLLFFVHAMDIRIRPTDRLARIIHDLIEITDNWDINHKEIIYKKIFDHIQQAINIFIYNSNFMIGLETLNLLIILTMLPSKFEISKSKLEKYFCSIEKNSEKNDFYFFWITFMLYIKKKLEYQQLHKKLIDLAEDFLLNSVDMFVSAEYFMFYFDFIACPHIDEQVRKEMIEKVKNITFNNKQKPVTFNIDLASQVVLKKDFIVSWRNPKYLKNSLKKKKFIFSYN